MKHGGRQTMPRTCEEGRGMVRPHRLMHGTAENEAVKLCYAQTNQEICEEIASGKSIDH